MAKYRKTHIKMGYIIYYKKQEIHWDIYTEFSPCPKVVFYEVEEGKNRFTQLLAFVRSISVYVHVYWYHVTIMYCINNTHWIVKTI